MPLNNVGGSNNDYVIAEPAKRLIAYFIDCLFACVLILPYAVNMFVSNLVEIRYNYDTGYRYIHDENISYPVYVFVSFLPLVVPILTILLTRKDVHFKKVQKVVFILIFALRIGNEIVSRILVIPLFLTLIVGFVIVTLICFFFLYTVVQYWKNGQSFGKCRMKITVVNKDTGEKISFGYMFLRETVGKAISGLIFSLGYIFILIDRDKQGFHDKFVGSIVVKDKK
jgi:uncharacterized RDD family membrane protein YckC